MNLLSLFHGGGKRRKSDENWDELEGRLSTAEARAKKVKGAILYTCPQPDPARQHGDYWVYAQNVACPWCEIARLREQIQLLVTRPTPRPGGISVQAPADGARISIPADEPATDVNAKTQAVDVAELRNAMGEGDTQTLPVVPAPVTAVLPLHLAPLPPITWGPGRDPEAAAVETNLDTPAPTPEFAATAVPPGLADVAHDRVQAALSEAS